MIPIDEECVVVTKCLVLVEEVQEPQSVKLRSEDVVIDRNTQNGDDK